MAGLALTRQMLRPTLAAFVFLLPLGAQQAEIELFEKKIRPVLVTKCYACHSAKLKSPMGSLVLDTKAGLAKGGANGPIVAAGKPAESQRRRCATMIHTYKCLHPASLPIRSSTISHSGLPRVRGIHAPKPHHSATRRKREWAYRQAANGGPSNQSGSSPPRPSANDPGRNPRLISSCSRSSSRIR